MSSFSLVLMALTCGPPDAPDKSMVAEKAGEQRTFATMKFCWCPAGKFKMGTPKGEIGRPRFEKDPVDVTLTHGFWLGKYEVTQEEYAEVMGKNPSQRKGPRLPVETVSWNDAVEFCKKLTYQERKAGRLSQGWEYTLPTEAQWEYACRAGTATAYYWGDDPQDLDEYAWVKRSRPRDVGLRKPNAWGLCDMSGNVMEWCHDIYPSDLPGGADPHVTLAEPGRIDQRVTRGGSWVNGETDCRSAKRWWHNRTERLYYQGFRVALVPTRPSF